MFAQSLFDAKKLHFLVLLSTNIQLMSAVVRLKDLVNVTTFLCQTKIMKHCFKNECTLVWLQKSFSKHWTCLIAPSIELLAQNLHYLHKVVTEQCIHFNSKPIQNLFTVSFIYSWNNYSIPSQKWILSKEPKYLDFCNYLGECSM